MQWRFQILDVAATLSGPDEFFAPIAQAYRRFASAEPQGRPLRVRVSDRDSRVATVGGARVRLIEGLDPRGQLYRRFLDALMDAVGSHAMLHAAALRARDGGAVLLAAPSGYGKTSLTLELLGRGLDFLGDDYAPLDLETASVAPYPRAVAVLPASADSLPAAFRTAAAEPGGAELFGKRLLDIGGVLGEERVVRQPTRLSHVVILTGGPPAASPRTSTQVALVSREADSEKIDRALGELPGLSVVRRESQASVVRWRIALAPSFRATTALSALLESESVVLYEKVWGDRPDFAAAPAAAGILRREAAEYLAREMLNRRARGQLLARYGQAPTALFLRLARSLRGATCWRVQVGDRRATTELILNLIAERAGALPD